jgi:hypothetical protein
MIFPRRGLWLQGRGFESPPGWSADGLATTVNPIMSMTKTCETMTDTLRDPKAQFRKADHLPRKTQRHRYERRKTKEFLHLVDWREDFAQ